MHSHTYFKLKGSNTSDKQTRVQIIKEKKTSKIKKTNKENENNNINNKTKKRNFSLQFMINNQGPWTEGEDLLVVQLVQQYGPHKWTFIASHLDGRIGKQCRERWHNHLNPQIKKSAWADDEEWVLYLYHRAIDNKWAEIAKHIVGRTDNSIKNHWNSGMKRRIPEFQERLNRFQQQFALEGSNLIEKINNFAEKKALEIILLNKKYESLLSESEDQNSDQEIQDIKPDKFHNLKLSEQRQRKVSRDFNLQSSFVKQANMTKSIRKKRTPQNEFKRKPFTDCINTQQVQKQVQNSLEQDSNCGDFYDQGKFQGQYSQDPWVPPFWDNTPDKFINHQENYQTPTGFQRKPKVNSSGRNIFNSNFNEANDYDPFLQPINFMHQFNSIRNPYGNP